MVLAVAQPGGVGRGAGAEPRYRSLSRRRGQSQDHALLRAGAGYPPFARVQSCVVGGVAIVNDVW